MDKMILVQDPATRAGWVVVPAHSLSDAVHQGFYNALEKSFKNPKEGQDPYAVASKALTDAIQDHFMGIEMGFALSDRERAEAEMQIKAQLPRTPSLAVDSLGSEDPTPESES